MKATTCFLICVALSGVASLVKAGEMPFQYIASDGKLPYDAEPEWARRGKVNPTLSEGQLALDVQAGEKGFFILGKTDAGEIYGQAGAWDGSTGTSTVEFRVQCAADDAAFEIFQVQISDGRKQWRLRFFNDRINPQGKSIDPTTPDLYRATIKDGRLTLSSARSGVILKDLEGGEPYSKEGNHPAGNCLWFGSFGSNPDLIGKSGRWALDFIRWTNQESDFEVPTEP